MTDLVFLHVLAGNGGNGRVSFRREKYVPKGGPDGGDGGSGGNIIVHGNKSLNTLREYAGKTGYSASHGGAGGKRNMTGSKGEDLVLEVPVGTTIWQVAENMTGHKRRVMLGGLEQPLSRDKIRRERFELLKEGQFTPERPADNLLDEEKIAQVKATKKFDPEALELTKLTSITKDGQEIMIVQGGIGGRGNTHFKSSAMTTPLLAEYGTFGEQRLVAFELKLLADIGLVGFPNAGKSTLLSRLTSARPKVAAYPFTTLEPHLGIYHSPKTDRELVIADIPGLIEGASEGKGLGFQFLRHVENCKILLNVLALDDSIALDEELSVEEKVTALWTQYTSLQKELSDYSNVIKEKPATVVVNKIDIYSEELQLAIKKEFKKKKKDVLFISAFTGEGLEQLEEMFAEFS